MKLVLYLGNENPHIKNHLALNRMCKSLNIDFEETRSIDRIQKEDYNILVSCNIFINPNMIPKSIKIIMGPQFFVLPFGPIVGKNTNEFSDRCVYNVLSPWIRDLYLEFAEDFIVPMAELPFGVDTEKFRPLEFVKEYECIVYIKRRSSQLVNTTIELLNNKNIKYLVFRYGSYNEKDYMDALNRCKFMLVLDAHESQGFALEEAMSMNIPLLVLDAQSMYDEMDNGVNATYEYLRPKRLLATSVPYWSDECGIKLNSEEGLEEAVEYMLKYYPEFRPREYVLRTLSDEVCMRRILDYFNIKLT